MTWEAMKMRQLGECGMQASVLVVWLSEVTTPAFQSIEMGTQSDRCFTHLVCAEDELLAAILRKSNRIAIGHRNPEWNLRRSKQIEQDTGTHELDFLKVNTPSQ